MLRNVVPYPADGKIGQLEAEQQNEDRPDPERGNRHRDDNDDPDRVVGELLALQGSDQAERQCDQEREHLGVENQEDRRSETLEDEPEYGRLVSNRGAQDRR